LEYLQYVLIGLFAGFFAGLLGIGGGAIIVPLTILVFMRHGVAPEHMLHVALGTCMATIVFTAASSLRAHHRHGAVLWPVVRTMTPGLVAGGFFGTWLARYIPTLPLAILFGCFVTYAATQMLVSWKPRPSAGLPGRLGLTITGFLLCTFCALVAVGGAALVIPFLVFCAVPFHTAIGTAAAIGFPIALASTAGYIFNGWAVDGLPSPHLGYIYLPALVCISAASMLIAPLGAAVAHRVPAKTLKKVFAFLMYGLIAKMVWDLAR